MTGNLCGSLRLLSGVERHAGERNFNRGRNGGYRLTTKKNPRLVWGVPAGDKPMVRLGVLAPASARAPERLPCEPNLKNQPK
jgi:hypothetical protein